MYGDRPRPGRNWFTVLGGAVLGFLAWFLAMVVVVIANYDTTGGMIEGVLLWVLGAVFLSAVGLIVWPRTRRLGEGFLLGFAIGLVVAGGICIPLSVGSA